MPTLPTTDRYAGLSRAAEVSSCGRYRYWLRRTWASGGNGRVVCFVMLNPSTADAAVDDPTIRRCMGFARAWGYSVLTVLNLFALRATDPAELRTAVDPVGPFGNVHLGAGKLADLVIAAWGANVPFGRDRTAVRLLTGKPLFCLGTTKAGHPRHPLYVRADQLPIPFTPR
jgi:hypothetical protein